MAATVFISYAHRDEALLDELLVALRALAADGVIDIWHDRRLAAGDDIFPNIEAALDRAQIVLLMVSEAFLLSHECTREMWRALASREQKRSVVVPVILQPCNWRAAPFGRFNALPTDGEPIASARDRTSACAGVARGVRHLAERWDERNGSVRRRRRRAVAWVAAAACIAGALASRASWLPWFTRQPLQIATPSGVDAVAELIVVAPGGSLWNPGAKGAGRLPNLLLCFRQDESPATEVCQPAVFGLRGSRAQADTSRTHVAGHWAGMTAWSETFSVDIGDRQGTRVRRIGRGHCRFGVPCAVVADGGAVVGDLLVLPAKESAAPHLRTYLDRCVDPRGRLARQWLTFAAAAGVTVPDLARTSQTRLAQAFLSMAEVRLAPSMLDAVAARTPAAFAALAPGDTTRAAVILAATSSVHGEAGRPLEPAEVDAVRSALREAIRAATVDDGTGCR